MIDQKRLDFQSGLLDWFEAHGRQFPWRETRNPYAVLLAEKLLQQTVARRAVVEIYEELLLQFPSPAELAKARVKDVRTYLLNKSGEEGPKRSLPILTKASKLSPLC